MAEEYIPGDFSMLGLTALVTIGYQLFFFVIAATCKFDKVTDLAGGTNFVLIAALTLGLAERPVTVRQVVDSILVIIWGLRLSGFLLYRILQWGEDRRFDDKRENLLKFAAFWIFQAVWAWTVSLPLTLTNGFLSGIDPDAGAADFIGLIMWAFGFLIECWADHVKLRFKQDPENKGKWCDKGPWKWSRHPNYAGELTLWWGFFIRCAAGFAAPGANAGAGVWVAAVISPLFITYLLLGFSGMPLLEASGNKRYGSRDDYRIYKQRTSPIFLLPPSLYAACPKWFKTVFLLEWPIFNRGLSGDTLPLKQGEGAGEKGNDGTRTSSLTFDV